MHFALQKNADAQRICLDMQAGLCLGICWQKIHAAIQSMPPPWDHKEDDWNPGPMSSYSPCTCRGKLKSDLMLFQRCLANACLTHLSSLMVPRNTLSPFRNHGPSRIPPIKFASNKVGIIFAITMRDWIPNLDRMSTPSSSLGAFNLLQHRHLTDLDCLYIHFLTRLAIRGRIAVRIYQDVLPFLVVQSKVRCHIKAGWSAALILNAFTNSLSHTSAQGNQVDK